MESDLQFVAECIAEELRKHDKIGHVNIINIDMICFSYFNCTKLFKMSFVNDDSALIQASANDMMTNMIGYCDFDINDPDFAGKLVGAVVDLIDCWCSC